MQILHLSISTSLKIDDKVSQLLITVISLKISEKTTVHIYLSDFVKTWPLGAKKVRNLPSWSVQLDSPGTALTVGRWLRPGGQN